MRLGLDVHGVITEFPKFFSELSRIFIHEGHEIHIITGSQVNDILFKKLNVNEISYSKIFSISDYHISKGTAHWFSSENNPWLEEDIWNRSKADYCKNQNIGFHIDDSMKYGAFFETPYCLVCREHGGCFKWSYKESHQGQFLFDKPQQIYERILNITKKLGFE